MTKLHPKQVQIQTRIYKNIYAYCEKENRLIVNLDKNYKDTFVSNVAVSAGNGTNITILYSGKSNKVPDNLLDKFLCAADTSYNPSRPFRWYKGGIISYTDEKGSVKKGRKESFDIFLKQIEFPKKIWIYEID